MSENLPTQFPKPPELHPLRSLQAKVWQILGLALIIGGLIVMGWGGWLFYQQQAELYNPPAPILEVAVTETFETPTSQPPSTQVNPTANIQKMSVDPPAIEPDNTPTLESSAPTQELNPVMEVPLETEIDIEPEFSIEEATTPKAGTISVTEFAEETAPTSNLATEALPSLADNPLIVVEKDISTPVAETAFEETAITTTSPPTQIVAESIDLDAPVVETGWQDVIRDGVPTKVWMVADYAAGWHQNSMLPGQGGNIVLSGHHNIKGEVFRYIVDLEIDDTVNLYVGDQIYNYVVNDKFIVKDKGEPESVRRANAKWIGPFNEERLTLVTCWPYTNNTHRVIVIAKPM
jgi:LPXTG-site transpeptidase (sortase) family protein